MKNILETIIKNLVEKPNEVSINEIIGETTTVYKVMVAEEDMGKVIGKNGKIAQSIRSIMKSISSKQQKRVTVEFIDQR